jgi:hypothetical protein
VKNADRIIQGIVQQQVAKMLTTVRATDAMLSDTGVTILMKNNQGITW